MLVLTRKVCESIYIGEVHIVVAKVQGNRASLVIDAPRTMNIARGELLPKKEDDTSDPDS